jgi:hypothetical protein
MFIRNDNVSCNDLRQKIKYQILAEFIIYYFVLETESDDYSSPEKQLNFSTYVASLVVKFSAILDFWKKVYQFDHTTWIKIATDINQNRNTLLIKHQSGKKRD